MENRQFTQKDADEVFRAISAFCEADERWDVKVSIDGEYFILTCNGEDIIHDSACEDCYEIGSAIGMFQSYLTEYYSEKYGK